MLLVARDIRKHYPGVQALDGVSLHVAAGEVLAVVGENGAGKSTLMKILAGVERPDAGELHLDGQPVRLHGVADALARGIVLIHQELNLADNLSAAANVFLGREPTWGGPLRLVRRAALHRDAAALLQRVGLACSPDTRVGNLPPGQRQLVEIARALSLKARVLIMDEPSSCLSQHETDLLFDVIRALKKEGVAVVYISHRLGEVKEVSDRVTVLRDGKNAGELPREQIHHDALVRLMVGRDFQQFFERHHRLASPHQDLVAGAYTVEMAPTRTPHRPAAPPRLEVRSLRYAGGPAHPVSFKVEKGEIVGMAGLVGAGRTELAEALFGIRRVSEGEILLDGEVIAPRNPREAVAAGLLLVPEDRRYHGLVVEDSVAHNLGLPNLSDLALVGLLPGLREHRLARRTRDRLRIKAARLGHAVGTLSGGNQQKVVLGKWLARQPRLLILDEPTRGIDVGAKSEIYHLMDELAGQGVGILMISSDMEEVLGLSDRVLVLHEGRLAGTLARAQLSEEAIMHLATGSPASPADEPGPAAPVALTPPPTHPG